MGLLDELRLAKKGDREAWTAFAQAEASAPAFSWGNVVIYSSCAAAGMAIVVAIGTLLPRGFEEVWAVVGAGLVVGSMMGFPRGFQLGRWAQRNRPLGGPLKTAGLTWIASLTYLRSIVALIFLCLLFLLAALRHAPPAKPGWYWVVALVVVLVVAQIAGLSGRLVGAMSAARTEGGSPPSDDGGQRQQPDDIQGPPPATAAP